MLEEYFEAEKIAEKALQLADLTLCARCAESNFGHRAFLLSHYNNKLNCLLSIPKNEWFLKWKDDIKHGYFHGISTFIVAYFLHREELNNLVLSRHIKSAGFKSKYCEEYIFLDKLLASCLLHDILKCNGFSQDEHDGKLSEYFPGLLKSTYTHSKPQNYNESLIISDVLELRRYEDYSLWYKPGKIEEFVDPKTLKLINIYYNYIRPSLQKLYENRFSAWIRHGPEKALDLTVDKYPQYKIFGIEIDRIPFIYCFNHGITNPWAMIKGTMPIEDFKLLGGKIHYGAREHLSAELNASFDEWVFVLDLKRKYFYSWVEALLEYDKKVVMQNTVKWFFKVTNSIFDRMDLLSSCPIAKKCR